MVEDKLDQYAKEKRVLWLVIGNSQRLEITPVIVRYSDANGPNYIIWGYSKYRGIPGFRTHGYSLTWARRGHSIVQLFDNQREAIDFFMATSKENDQSSTQLKQRLTPPPRFLKNGNFTHNITVEV